MKSVGLSLLFPIICLYFALQFQFDSHKMNCKKLRINNKINKNSISISKDTIVTSNKSNDIENLTEGVPKQIEYKGHLFDTYTVNLKTQNIKLHHKTLEDKKFKSIENLKSYFEQLPEDLLFATNGGIFTKQLTPVGLYVENKKELYPNNLSDGEGNFYMKPNGIFYLTGWSGGVINSEKYKSVSKHIKFATQSGPLLVEKGKISPLFSKNSPNKYIRSGVGTIGKTPYSKKVVFVVSKEPVNFYDFAMLFKEILKCSNALYLDGAISEMYLPELKRYDTEGNFSILISVTNK